MESDVEKLIEKGLDNAADPNRKTRYQIKQEEKRKNAELKHKQEMTKLVVGLGLLLILPIVLFLIIGVCGGFNP